MSYILRLRATITIQYTQIRSIPIGFPLWSSPKLQALWEQDSPKSEGPGE